MYLLLLIGRVELGNRIVADPKEYCSGWEDDGFECVSKKDCGEDGHFSSEGSQVITGPRTADVNFLNKVYLTLVFVFATD